MKKNIFGSKLSTLLFIAATVLSLWVAFTLITGMSPLEALNVRPLAATAVIISLLLTFVVLPIVYSRMSKRK